MIIGVKYCGGCNPIYNRGRQVELLKHEFPEHEFRTPSQGKTCDIWLSVCGCPRACADVSGLIADKRLFILNSEKSFTGVRSFLKEERDRGTSEIPESPGLPCRKKLRIGQEASYTKCFFKDDVIQFAALTGDKSRLHTSTDFAADTPYKKPVVHGVLSASLISTVMGTELPGEGTVFIEEQVRFLKPVFYGDTITAKVRLLSCRESSTQYIGTLGGVCVNQNGETVAAAKCRQLMTKNLFEIENPKDTASMEEAESFWGSESEGTKQ